MFKKDKKNGESELTGEYAIPSTRKAMLSHVGNAMSIVSDVIEPFVPLFGIVDKVMDSLNTIYDNAKCNKKMCGALIDRIGIVEQATKSLKRRKNENAANFSKQEYYRAWVKFTNVLKNINDFAKDVTQQSVFQKYLNANIVKEAYDKNIKEFEDACRDLQFSIDISNMISDEQREEENKQILEELNLIAWAMSELSDDVKNISKQITILSEQLSSQKLNPGDIKVPYVKGSELTYPETKPGNVRGSQRTIVKRLYHKTCQVACKKIQAIEKNETAGSRSIQTQLVILGLLGKCPNIITFYGLSEIEQNVYMVFEWAEYGNLKEVYEKYTIPLPTKLQFISNIFKGLYFISDGEVLHHDVRCENILVTKNLDVKISNFEMSRQIHGISTTILSLEDYVRWLAPEKMRDMKYRYNHKCEIFSFGMLVWELIHQKIPYKDMTFHEVQEHVKNKKREYLSNQLNSDPILIELTKLIKKTWDDDPELRLSFAEIYLLIKNLEKSVLPTSPRIDPKTDNSDVITDLELSQSHQKSGSISSHFDDPKKCPDSDDCFLDDGLLTLIKPFEDGIIAHREKRYKDAWECFNEHANLGLSLAKNWKGYYLEKGLYIEKDVMEGLKWLKSAADDGVPDAQLRYAKGLINLSKSTGSKENYKTILEYMKKAADGGNETAQINLSKIYFTGQFGVKKDEKKGNEFFELASLRNPKLVKPQ
ncbi:10219_t:CDS:2 [Diversispora eburnea]|uniref:10219_t:CDS:1 n=1 Tax=Diversispora eburnea TaxID=1213867 RepID=A0A9N8W1E3_9GLOM|nr:10219_t:CDS:2 [Diversispora eburnea]